jgi:hypothetical protein
MKHAGDEALDALEDLLAQVRRQPGLKEKKRGAFYRKASGILHFHEDPAGLFADLKLDGEFKRFPVNTPAERAELLAKLAAVAG